MAESGARDEDPSDPDDGLPVRVEVPHHEQTLDVTCGAASLMMAMGAFDPSLDLDRDLELTIWREANLVEVWGTSREGLALAASRRGFRVSTKGDTEGVSFVEALRDELPEIDEEMLRRMYEHTRDQFRDRGLEDATEAVTVGDVEAALRAGSVPVVLVDGAMLWDEAIPHWVAACGATEEAVEVQDPAQEEGPRAIPREEAEALLGFRGIHCAVVVHGLEDPAEGARRRR